MDKQALIKGGGFLLLVFVAAFGGVYAGMRFRQAQAPSTAEVRIPDSKLTVGQAFPDVGLRSPQGQAASSAALVDGGGVVMFLSLDCQPCAQMVARWSELEAAGELAGVTTVGITSGDPSRVEPYREEKGLRFPIYLDPERTFIRDWEVQAVPYVVVVGPDGAVRERFSSPADIDVEQIRGEVGLG